MENVFGYDPLFQVDPKHKKHVHLDLSVISYYQISPSRVDKESTCLQQSYSYDM